MVFDFSVLKTLGWLVYASLPQEYVAILRAEDQDDVDI
jgi:hypothetical protein